MFQTSWYQLAVVARQPSHCCHPDQSEYILWLPMTHSWYFSQSAQVSTTLLAVEHAGRAKSPSWMLFQDLLLILLMNTLTTSTRGMSYSHIMILWLHPPGGYATYRCRKNTQRIWLHRSPWLPRCTDPNVQELCRNSPWRYCRVTGNLVLPWVTNACFECHWQYVTSHKVFVNHRLAAHEQLGSEGQLCKDKLTSTLASAV